MDDYCNGCGSDTGPLKAVETGRQLCPTCLAVDAYKARQEASGYRPRATSRQKQGL